jgi:C1A family cysteine protease
MTNYKFNLKRSPVDTRDILVKSVYPQEIILPDTLDLRGNLPPVRDQGTQGSCSAQTVAEMKEWEEKTDIGFKGYMSPQFVYNLREEYGEEGMTPRDTLKIVNKIGIVKETSYPYGKIENLDEATLPAKLADESKNYRILSYARIDTVDSLKKALYINGPCYIAFPVYNPNKLDFWNPDYKGQEMLGGHAVSVVGWTKDSFIIRNHWSAEWGDHGYTYFKFAEWGTQWECCPSVDEKTPIPPSPIEVKKECFFKRIFGKK